MRLTMMLAVLSGFCVADVAAGQDKDKPPFTADLSRLQQQGFPLKLNRFSMESKDNLSHITFVLQFDNDLVANDLNLLRGYFNDEGFQTALYFYFFDDENVPIEKLGCSTSMIEGEITGVKGDAFRVVLKVPVKLTERTKKMAWRFEPRTGKPLAIDSGSNFLEGKKGCRGQNHRQERANRICFDRTH